MIAEKAPFESAKYIKAQEHPSDFSFYDPIPFFRKEIVLDEEIKDAQIVVQSPGFGEYYINGKPITSDRFISPFSDYNKILWYNTYDVTSLLHRGKNVICVIAGNGFFNESFRTEWKYCLASWRDAPQFILKLTVNGKTKAVSDESWKCSREHSHIIYSHLRSGEYVDARKRDDNWLTADYDDSDWQSAIVRKKELTAKFLPTPCQPIREFEKIAPVSIQKTESGNWLVDFGVTMSGYIDISVCAPRGSEILFRYTEDIYPDGSPKYNDMTKEKFYPQTPFQTDKLIASGSVDHFKPHFSYYGFRYVLIEGLDEKPAQGTVFAHFVHQAVDKKADFTCGNDILNFIYRAGIRSSYSNMFWCMTDCPTREKLGWTNDAQASAEQLLINFDILPLFEKWFEDIKAGLREDGSLCGIVPAPDDKFEWGMTCGPVCDCILFELPYRIYLYTGNAKILTDAIPYFERYTAFLEQKIAEGYEFTLGDWMGGSRLPPRIPKQFCTDFYLIKARRITALAHRLANTGVLLWEEKAKQAADTFIATYLLPDGRCTLAEQSSISMMLTEKLYTQKQPLVDQLLEVVERDECKLTSGMVGVQYLYDALTICHRPDLAYRIMTESEPGYKTWFESGATTLWEMWDGTDHGSHNHHMYSGVIAWFFKSLLGIKPCIDAPAFEAIELHPCLIAELGFVKGEVQTVRGKIAAEWHYDGEKFLYTVTVPDGMAVTFDEKQLHAGENQFKIDREDAFRYTM